MPTDNKQPQSSSLPPIPTDDMSPLVVEDTTPPMLNDNDLPVVNTPPAVTVEEKPSETASGSAAPSDDVVMAPIVTTQKKKFAGGKVIATILGLLLLVGGVGAGTYLVQQQQDIRERAGACGGGCGGGRQCAGDTDGDGDGECVPRGTTDEQVEQDLADDGVLDDLDVVEVDSNGDGNVNSNPDTDGDGVGDAGAGLWSDPDGDGVFDPPSNGTCPSGSYQCGGDGAAFDFCLSTSVGKTCNEAAIEEGYVVPIGCSNPLHIEGIGDGNNATWTPGEFVCPPTTLENTVIYLCTRAQYEAAGGICDGRTPGRIILNHIPGSFCGIIQVDENIPNGDHQSFESTSGCGGNDTPPDDTPPPTTPSITAQCQNVKAYSSTWTLLTNAQLAALAPNTTINFCVAGSATGGSFNKAKFTINGVVQAETTTIRPSSTDFCQLYVIPAGVTTFNVSAQINHVTLGWK